MLTAIEPALHKLDEIESLPPDWDSYGAAPPSSCAVKLARDLLNSVSGWSPMIALTRIRPFSIAPIPSGGIQIDWRAEHFEIEVDIDPEGKLGYLFIHKDGDTRQYDENEGVSVQEILDRIRRVLLSP